MDLPFELYIINGYSKDKVLNYTTSQEDLKNLEEKNILKVTENIDLSIIFLDSENSRLYMDGLDTLPESQINIDEKGEVYFSPSTEEQNIFKYGNEYYPLIPGYYRLMIITPENNYYSLIKVETKEMEIEQWEIMRDEIENKLNGLAQDIMRKNTNINIDNVYPIPFSLMRQFIILNENKSRLISTIEDIISNPRYELKKKYHLVQDSRIRRIDEHTIKYKAEHPNLKNLLKEPEPVYSYKLKENIMLKHIVKKLNSITKILKEFLLNSEKKVMLEIKESSSWGESNKTNLRLQNKMLLDIQKMKNEIRKIEKIWNKLLISEWNKELEDNKQDQVPLAMLFDNRYNFIYQIYREMLEKKYSISLDESFKFHWKRTDKLYEIWGFIKVVETLLSEKMGYEAVEGWLLENPSLSTNVEVPELSQGSYVIFRKKEIEIIITYDEVLPSSSEKTTLKKPLYTSSNHNRPDCRIDVYDEKGHIGSILLDFKYRPLHNIWKDSLMRKSNPSDVMKQLNNYSSMCRSPWLYKGRMNERQLKQIRPVFEVWPVYPGRGKKNDRELNEHQIRLVDLSPGEDHEYFIEILNKAVDEIVNNAP